MIQVQYENSWINIWMREYISWDTHHLLMFCINVHHRNSHELQRLLPSNYQRCENIVSMLMTTVCCLSLFSRLKLNLINIDTQWMIWIWSTVFCLISKYLISSMRNNFLLLLECEIMFKCWDSSLCYKEQLSQSHDQRIFQFSILLHVSHDWLYSLWFLRSILCWQTQQWLRRKYFLRSLFHYFN